MAAPNPSAMMNQTILGAYRARRDRPIGLLDRLHGVGRLNDNRQERLNLAMANYEDAIKRGDDVAAGIADTQIEKLLAESRAEHREGAVSNVGQTAEPAPVPQFDGGVRRPVVRQEPPNMNRLIAGHARASRALAQAARESV